MVRYIITIIITICLVYLVYYLVIDKSRVSTNSETFCMNNELKIDNTNAVDMPNIPYDMQITHKIGGNHCKPLDDGLSLTAQNGKYVFPIMKLLYDGIWDNKDIINKNVGIKKWQLTDGQIIYDGYYSSDKYYHVPIKTIIPFDNQVSDTTTEPYNVRLLYDNRSCKGSEIKCI